MSNEMISLGESVIKKLNHLFTPSGGRLDKWGVNTSSHVVLSIDQAGEY